MSNTLISLSVRMNSVMARCGVAVVFVRASARDKEDGRREMGKLRARAAAYRIAIRHSSGLSAACLLNVYSLILYPATHQHQHHNTTPSASRASVFDNMKVTIKEWNAVASWRWDMPEDEVCGICRVQFDGTCPTCKFPGDDCALCMCSQ